MNVNEEDFQKRLDEIGKHYEDAKDALSSIGDPAYRRDCDKVFTHLRSLRDIAAIAVRQAYQIKEN